MLSLSDLPNRMPDNPVRAIFARAATIPDCIRLEVGQPDFRTPEHICQAAEQAIRDGWHYYTPMGGLPSLKERVIAKLTRVNQISASTDQIVIGNGATAVLSGAMVSLAGIGDEVLIPDPHWGGYLGMAALAGAEVVRYPCPAENGYLPDLEQLDALITPRTKLLVINSPYNPAGVIFSREALREVGEIAARRGLWILSDEAYDQIVLDGTHVAPSMLSCADPERVIAAFTFSKTYAMPGWRIGYGCGPKSAIQAITKACDGMYSCINT
ncbi:MAG: pyridoxal phosphate-dependent aminotransferase, partial [Candidatus Dormibacteraceae bacterium]